jgi:hypothetical protein
MSGFLYYGEAAGPRILRANVGSTQVTPDGVEDVLLEAMMWDLIPAGPSGDAVFRSVDAEVSVSAGYDVEITPFLDGKPLGSQRFTAAGKTTEPAQAFVAERGNRLSALVRQQTAAVDFELQDVTAAFSILRTTP